MKMRAMIRSLAREFDAEDNAAADLWTWLPSHASAVKHWGDYASEFRPSLSDLMAEAALLQMIQNGTQDSLCQGKAIDMFYVDTDALADGAPIPTAAEKMVFIEKWFRDRKINVTFSGPL